MQLADRPNVPLTELHGLCNGNLNTVESFRSRLAIEEKYMHTMI